jgi:hypothetical protein
VRLLPADQFAFPFVLGPVDLTARKTPIVGPPPPPDVQSTIQTIIAANAEKDGKIRVASTLWTDAKVIMPDEVFEVRSVERTLRLTRKDRVRDENDGPEVSL